MKEVIKKWWFWVIAGFVLISLAAISTDVPTKEPIVHSDQFVVQIGSKNVRVNDLELTLDTPVRELDWHSYMPLRFFLDWFGAEDVTYDRATEVITFKLTRYQELDPAIIAKYDAKNKLAKPVEPKKEETKPVEPPKKVEIPAVIKEPVKKDETINTEEMKSFLLNTFNDSFGHFGTCRINEELQAFTITPFDDDFVTGVVLAKQGNAELKKIWDTSLSDYKLLSREIYNKLPGYSVMILNSVNTDLILLCVTNGVVLIDAVNNP
jgi:hypothetical protein